MYLTLARKFLAEGDEDRARSIILAHRREPCTDPEVHYQWGLLCEEIAAFNLARQSYEEALRLSPRNAKYLYCLGLLCSDAGQYEKSLHYLTRAINHAPDYAKARKLLAGLLEAMGREGSARAVKEETKEEPSPFRYFPPSLGTADLNLFLHLFSGREVGYATQDLKPGTGQAYWTYHEGIVTPEAVEKHIYGEITLGGLPLRSDNTVKYAAIHIRPYQRIVFRYLKNPSILMQLEEAAQEQARNLVAACAAQGISAYIEDPGQRSRRVWFFFNRFFHLLLIKRFLDRILHASAHLREAASVSDSRLVVEPLLATQPVGIGWQEQAVLLPLGIDCQTEKRGLFIDTDGIPFPEQLKFIRKIREIDEPQVRSVLKSSSICVGYGQRSAGKQDLWRNCPVLAELISKAQSGRKLSSNEKLILFYTLGLSAKARHFLHDVLEPCPDYNYQKVERMLNQLKLHPISCLKIRSLVPEVTVSVQCSCIFDLRGGKYPSPFLHLEPGTSLCVAQEDFNGASLKELARGYFLLLAKREEVVRDLERLEMAIDKQLARKGIDELKTPYGILRRVVRGEKPALLVER